MNVELNFLQTRPKKEINGTKKELNFIPTDYKDVIPLSKIFEAKKDSDKQKNCFGTAQFLNGEIESDIFQDSVDTIKRICSREPINKPIIGCYIVLDNLPEWKNHISHMGIITELNPLKMIHRSKRQGSLRVDLVKNIVNHFDEIYLKRKDPEYKGIDVKYYPKLNND